MARRPEIKKSSQAYIFKYPEIAEIADKQNEIFWTHTEIDVEKDLHDLKTNFTESEYHGVVTTLKLFTLYELMAGSEYWGGRFKKMFPRPEFQRLGSCFSHFELNVHAPFYDKINKVLGLDTKDFYTDYLDDETLKNRMGFIEKCINSKSDLFSLAVFSLVEGAILYSSFAFLKHFQAEGKNKLINVAAGINFSVRDENLHSETGAYIYKLLLKEVKDSVDLEKLETDIIEAAHEVLAHEEKIIEMIFSEGPIKGITDKQMVHFVESRLDLCLENLGIEKQFKPTYNPISKWFYKNISGGQFHDFFTKVGSEYNRDWIESRFNW